MSANSTSPQKLTFDKPQYFTQSTKTTTDKWYCNICTSPNSSKMNYMSIRAAQDHERDSAEHARNVVESEEWWGPAPDVDAWTRPIVEDPPLTIAEIKMRESRVHVDLVQDMVPFWIRGVEAAERGEVLRLEEFLENLAASDPWFTSAPDTTWADENKGPAWEWGAPDEGAGGWGEKTISSARESLGKAQYSIKGQEMRRDIQNNKRPKKRMRPGSTQKKGYEFVEEIARQEAVVDEERKQRMHSFFEMPLHEKMKKIDETIRGLNAVVPH